MIPKITSEKTVWWKCESCSICITCGAREAGKAKNSRWNWDYTLCVDCTKKWVGKKYCPVCEVFWDDWEIGMIECTP